MSKREEGEKEKEKKHTLSAKYDKETKVFGISYYFFILQHMEFIARIVELHTDKEKYMN